MSGPADAPIGVFDSGIGGLTVVRELLQQMPEEGIVYFGDTARVPYGTKSADTVTRFSRENALFLERMRVKFLIVACNSASALALPTLQREFRIPMIGVIEPGARAAAAATRNGRIGVIGTQATIGSRAYDAAIHKIDDKLEVVGKACPLFVPLAEEGWVEGEVAESVARTYLAEVLDHGIDTLILGCTHYPLLKDTLQRVVGDDVTLVDTAVETITEVQTRLVDSGLRRGGTGSGEPDLGESNRGEPGRGEHAYYVSDVPGQFRQVGERFLGHGLEPLVWVDQNDLPWYERGASR